MGYEIDFLAVGEESKGGDAIAVRYGDLHASPANQTVIVIDGGYAANGERMVDHIRRRFSTNRVDMVVSTHPDQDHVGGLEVVLEQLDVGQLLMHQPWKHSTAIAAARQVAFKSSSLSEALEKSLEGASELESIAVRKGIPIVEPFAGMATPDGAFRILGPTSAFYEELLGTFQPSGLRRMTSAIAEALRKAAAKLVPESLHEETLRDDGSTSPQNNTSVISLLTYGGHLALFTGDAGIPAIEGALDLLESDPQWQPGKLQFVQVPHHGSRRNIGPTSLDRLLGQKGQAMKIGTAFVSSPAKNPEEKHPAKKVANAFSRRGYPVCATQGKNIWHYSNAPARADYSAIDPLPFFQQVEEDGDA